MVNIDIDAQNNVMNLAETDAKAVLERKQNVNLNTNHQIKTLDGAVAPIAVI